jgi:ABC-2 type transport system permease protein
MPSKTSWINKEVIIQSLRNVGWIGIVYFIGLLFSLPVDIIGKLSNDNQPYPIAIYENLFKMQYPVQMGLMLFVPVILSLFLFRYLHVKQAADFMHSLPLTRSKLFYHFTVTGFFILIIPVVLNTAILLSLYSLTDLHQFISVQNIFIWCGITIIMNILLFTAATFVAMITGLTAVQGVMTYILLLLPAGMFMLVCFSLKNLLYGFPEEYFFNIQIEQYSPVIKAVYLENKIFSGLDVTLFIAITLLLYVLSYVLYKTRKVEAASLAIVFPVLRPLFKYGVAFCFMLVGGMYFNGIYQESGWTLFGYFIGSFIGYYLAEMVLQKHWRVFRHWKGFAGFAVVISLIGLFIQFDLFQYEKKIPEFEDVEKVHVSPSYYSLTDNPESLIEEPFISEAKTIEAVLDLHEEIVNNQDQNEYPPDGSEQIFFYYKMKNGSKLVRNYQVNIDDFKSQYASLYEMKNYKETTEQIFTVDSSKVDKLSIYSDLGNRQSISIVDPVQINEAIGILTEETYNDTFEDRDRVNLYNVELLLSENQWIHVGVRNNDKKFESWLQENGYLEDIRVTTSDVEWMYVIDQERYRNRLFNDMDPDAAALELKKESKGIEITDSKHLEAIMDQLVYNQMTNEYMVIIKYKTHGNVEVRGLKAKDTPSFLKSKTDN